MDLRVWESGFFARRLRTGGHRLWGRGGNELPFAWVAFCSFPGGQKRRDNAVTLIQYRLVNSARRCRTIDAHRAVPIRQIAIRSLSRDVAEHVRTSVLLQAPEPGQAD
jgi:hypothetical protein